MEEESMVIQTVDWWMETQIFIPTAFQEKQKLIIRLLGKTFIGYIYDLSQIT